jgi:hypothetical protein
MHLYSVFCFGFIYDKNGIIMHACREEESLLLPIDVWNVECRSSSRRSECGVGVPFKMVEERSFLALLNYLP